VRILITGAAGNLGARVAQHLMRARHELRLLAHRSSLPFEISGRPDVSVCRADLSQPLTLGPACAEVDCVVHLAGVLFAPLPGRFLPKTNLGYVRNLTQAAMAAGVRKFVLVSFPHAEGETTPDCPARGRLDRDPEVVHFRTRLQAERYLVETCKASAMTPVVFRAGIVYGPGVKLIEAARWMLRHHLMAIWRRPTWAHLIALPDFLEALQAAIENPNASGIYQVSDDGPLLLQDFLDRLADHDRCPRPWRLPAWVFHLAGAACEAAALIFRTATPLNRDIVRAGMTSCVADNSRMKRELLPALSCPTIAEGIQIL
jgi:nucleoside-diphosphate-sugar epimerase